LLRRFNIEACKGKAFLPMDYAEQEFDSLTEEQQKIVENFEGRKSYKPFVDNIAVFKLPHILKIVGQGKVKSRELPKKKEKEEEKSSDTAEK